MTAKTTAALRAEVPAGQAYTTTLTDIIDTLDMRTTGGISGSTGYMVRVTDPEFGAKGDGSTDDSAAFNNAITAAGNGGIVIVPPSPGNSYVLKDGVYLENGASLIGLGGPLLKSQITSTTTDVLSFGIDTSNTSYAYPTLSGLHIQGDATNPGRDLISVKKGIQLRVSDMFLENAGRDGFHVEAAWANDYLECCYFTNIKSYGSTRDGFHVESGNVTGSSYVNQTTFLNCNSRYNKTGHPLAIVNNASSTTAAAKISALAWINGELDVTNSSTSADCVYLHTPNGGLIEQISFLFVTIENLSGTKSGYAIRRDLSGGGSISVNTPINVIMYGMQFNSVS